MNTHLPTVFSLARWQRAAAAAVAATTGMVIVSIVLMSFSFNAPAVWLKSTPEVERRIAACDQLMLGATRTTCKQQIVVTMLASAPKNVFVAQK